jgi:hypothetical protein
MPFDDLRAFMSMLRPSIAVPVLILLIGVNAASWMVVLDRVGITRTLAWLMLVPPLTFLLPAYVAFARWPNESVVSVPARPRIAKRPPQRFARTRKLPHPPAVVASYRRPVNLASDGLPRHRIALPASSTSTPWLLHNGGLVAD